MKRLLLSLCLGASACASTPSRGATFSARHPAAPWLEKISASGRTTTEIRVVLYTNQLLELESGQSYKYALRRDTTLAIAPDPRTAEDNFFVHPVLGDGRPVLTAGAITVEHDGASIQSVSVDQSSSSYCPTFESLNAVVDELVELGVDRKLVRTENKPRDECKEDPHT